MSNNPLNTDEYYVMVTLNSVAALLTIHSAAYELRNTARSRWYLGTNIVAAVIQILAIAQFTEGRQNNARNYLILNTAASLVSQFLLLLLIHQNLAVLRCFEFLNEYACQLVSKYARIFLIIQLPLTTLTCFFWAFFLFYNTVPGYNIANTVYMVNSTIVGFFLILQTSVQNLWISWRVYKVAKKGKSKNVIAKYTNYLYILLAVFLNDM